ncbi:MAG: choice-of-anchor Q domain-containing protein, partial [Tepidisphaerales bacterium]
MKTGVGIYGGYAGYGAADPNARDVVAYPSILSGDIGTAGSNTDNSYHVVVGSGTDKTAVLDGFSIVAGNANGSSPNDSGGGMINISGSPTLANCSFSGNSASYVGGAISDDYSSPTVTNCTFTRNTAASSGGGMSNYHTCSPTLIDCVFAGNSAGNATTGWGGGINNTYDASPSLVNCVFVGNSAVSIGGGMWTDAMTTSPPLAAPTVTNCTFIANSAAVGGALANSRDLLTVTNSILWGNSAPNASQLYQDGGTANVSYSDVQGGYYAGTHIINTDPLFVRNPSPGTDGKWGTVDDDYGNLRLRLNSPAIDAGKNGAVPAGVTTDLAGTSRFLDIPTIPNTGLGTSPLVDMGAFESSPADTGGPYVLDLLQNSSITLNGSGVSGVPGALAYAWEWTGDGQFDDATGPNPVFDAAGMPGSTRTIALRVTDAAQNSIVSTTTLTIIAPIYVDTRATGANNGTSWANAFRDLKTALGQAVAGRGIAVAAGTYKPTTTTDRNATFQLKNGVSVFGGYAGYGAANPYARDCTLYPSILSGDIGTINLKTDNSYHVVTGSGTDATAILDGFAISGGYANDSGSGMYNSAGSPTINNCIFKDNTASANGGGMYN